MKTIVIAGLFGAALALGAPHASSAADLGQPYGGSIKDGGYGEGPVAVHGPSGPCYIRGDLGYSWSQRPKATWPVTNATIDNTNPLAPVTTYAYAGDDVTDSKLNNAWFGGVGLGCSSGVRGLRGEVMFNQTGTRNFTGTPLNYSVTTIGGALPGSVTLTDPLHTSVKSTTLMFNGYKDFNNIGPFTPYIGAGVGIAYNKMSSVSFTGNPFLTNEIQGDSRLSLAWSLMAGVGYHLSDRAVLDLGYRYMDYGKAQSGQVDNLGFVNPIVRINDVTAHEFKVGLRYSLGGGYDAPAYQSLK